MPFFDKDTFRSREPQYKSPYGAVSSGTDVRFHLRPPRGCGCERAFLIASFEFDNNRTEFIEMHREEWAFGRDCYSSVLWTAGYVGLVWYRFRLEGGGKAEESETYQLTVYDGSEEVPDWFGKGVCYQIFPDRFFRTEIPSAEGLVGGRSVHRGWSEDPVQGPVRYTSTGKDICSRDFFGGNLKGIEAKLDYLYSLGVETLYLCPIFESAENHRYSTADYTKIDPMLGTEEDFRSLCRAAHERNMRVILDGVFNHVGFVSRYFNGDGFYPGKGAYQSEDSPYSPWFRFKKWPDDYECWWGIYSLPDVEENCADYRRFIYEGDDSIVRRWLKAGADGWRLDVADELPDDFIAGLHKAVRETKPEAAVIGEVWEDGTTKIAYDVRRKHLLGRHLDCLMNYPFRTALLNYLTGSPAESFMREMESLRENYPPFAFYQSMNALGTHDTVRILTYLGTGGKGDHLCKAERAQYRMTEGERALGLKRLALGVSVLMTFPGAPTVYYGDEAGMEGFEDPWNRRTYPWGSEDQSALTVYRTLGCFRRSCGALRSGALRWGPCRGSLLSFFRIGTEQTVCTAVNAGAMPVSVTLPWECKTARDLLSGTEYASAKGALELTLPAYTAVVLEENR